MKGNDWINEWGYLAQSQGPPDCEIQIDCKEAENDQKDQLDNHKRLKMRLKEAAIDKET